MTELTALTESENREFNTSFHTIDSQDYLYLEDNIDINQIVDELLYDL